ncbi:MAG: histidine phosphatase family protein [Clostridia bacterium]|nr:histidine phosphatase family protein [Clostridia bacterium]
MIFYFIRHGDPIYDPDSLTELGKKQAEALAKRFMLCGLDEIYASTSTRAWQTAEPTAKALGKEILPCPWAHESLAAADLWVRRSDGSGTWCFYDEKTREKFNDPTVRALGEDWHTHPFFKGMRLGDGIARMKREADGFFIKLGFEHDRDKAAYKPLNAYTGREKRVALFAHQGMGLAFLSAVLDVPYPLFCTRFDMTHTGVTVIRFAEDKPVAYPCVLQLSDTSHLYKQDFATGYNNGINV